MNDLIAVLRNPRAAAAGKARYLLVGLAVLVLDQWTKHWIEAEYSLHAVDPVIPGFFNLTHVRNTGVAFGMFASGDAANAVALSLLALFALGLVSIYFLMTPRGHKLLLTALGLVMGGAVGNLTDRVASGAVTDFLQFYVDTHYWPSFNVADSAITVGIAFMVLDAFRPRSNEEEGEEAATAHEETVAEEPPAEASLPSAG
jgi:signal peptidase II